jgi:hypothetical protein
MSTATIADIFLAVGVLAVCMIMIWELWKGE